MTTYSQLKTDLADWTNNASEELAGQLDVIIDLAERRIAREADLRHFRTFATATTTNADPYLYMPVDCLVVRQLRFVNGETLRLRPLSFLREYWPDETQTARPKYYAHRDDRFVILAPTPNAALDVEAAYTFRPDGLSALNPSTWLSAQAYDALLFACLVEAGTYLEGITPERQALYGQRYIEAITRLQGQEARNQADEY